MKILLLNPQVGTQLGPVETPLLRALQARGHALLVPADAREAWQMLQLHGKSVDLAVVHREEASGQGEPGLGFIQQVKREPSTTDLPIILTTKAWNEAQCAQHQAGPHGVHAYLRAPFTDAQLVDLIEQVMDSAPTMVGMAAPTRLTTAVPPPPPAGATQIGAITRLTRAQPTTELAHIAQPDLGASSVHIDIPNPEATSSGVPSFSLPPSFATPPPPPIESSPSGTLAIERPGEIAIPAINEDPSKVMPVDEVSLAEPEPQEPKFDPPPFEPEAAEPSFSTGSTDTGLDAQAEEAMPYLSSRRPAFDAIYGKLQPLDDAVVPGGAAQSPDVDTLKKYLLLREQDVGALSAQLRSAKEQIKNMDEQLRGERAIHVELKHMVEEQKRRIDDFEKEKQFALDAAMSEVNEMRFEMKKRIDQSRLLEARVKEATQETERLKERVRADIRKVRARERELENRLEIMKKDSEALLTAREQKIIELKRKMDVLEFNMDLLQDQYGKEKQFNQTLKERLARAAQVVRVAGGLLFEKEADALAAMEADASGDAKPGQSDVA